MIIEKLFSGTQKLEDVLLTLVEHQIDKLLNASYGKEGTNVTPDSKGVTK